MKLLPNKNACDFGDNICVISGGIYYTNEDIKTILTKEQFENNCYKIGDE